MRKIYFILIVLLLGVIVIIKIRLHMHRVEIIKSRGNIESNYKKSETIVIKVRGKALNEKNIKKNIGGLIDIEKILKDVEEKDLE